MNTYKVQCFDYGWTTTIQTNNTYAIGDLCICRGCICVIVG